MLITNYCVFVTKPKDGAIARSLDVLDIDHIEVATDAALMAMIVPKEFDLVVKLSAPEIEQVLHVINHINLYKRKVEMTVVKKTEAEILERAMLRKPSHWKAVEQHVHTKEELYDRLIAIEREDEDMAWVNIHTDPRTGLPLDSIPSELAHYFAEGPFKGDPLLHFFGPASKVNHKLGMDKRYCLITNACIYLAYLNGNLQRCVIVHDITELMIGASSVAMKISGDYDLYLKLPSNPEQTHKIADIIKRIYKFKTQADLKVSDLTPEAAVDAKVLVLRKPDGWKPRFAHVLQTQDLVDYLKKLGIKPDKTADKAALHQ
eukprot:NODE_4317_length_1081_cov_94.826722_g4118_i0.p1 GENE.NODE_4317_length_1081_cov_94.826722_g4118_i0~~NODE_4317_length_1081_cov_94.826722_g4118_i0.p1  ORF type:complete len:318 (+),score=80.70 NODE_4317_length_1081_cov_94.826722_g4118_i0:66-1019(+)